MKITKNQLKELIRQSIEELKFGSQAQYDAYKKKHKIKPGTKVKVGDKTTTHKGKAKLSKKSKSAADRMAAKLNAKMDKYNKNRETEKHLKQMDGDDEESMDDLFKQMGESKGRKRTTVKEVKQWMRTLEENRYKKTYASDARRVSWLVNHMGESLDNMPMSMKKKWSKAQYGRERFLAKEFTKHLESKQMNESKLENKLREIIREVIKRELNEAYRSQSIFFDKNDKSKLQKIIKKYKGKYPFNPPGESVVNWSVNDRGSKGIEWGGIPKANYNKAVEFFMKNKLNPRG